MLVASPSTPTLSHDDTYDLPTLHVDHAGGIVEGCLLLRTLSTLFLRAQESATAPAAASGGPSTPIAVATERNLAALDFVDMPSLVRATVFLLESAMPRGAGGVPGPGGFALVRAAGALVAAVQSSTANAHRLLGLGGLDLVAVLLAFVRAVEVRRWLGGRGGRPCRAEPTPVAYLALVRARLVLQGPDGSQNVCCTRDACPRPHSFHAHQAASPDPCLRHLDPALPASKVYVDDDHDGGSRDSGADSSSDDDDDSDLDASIDSPPRTCTS
jgi:hypothetical protein